ncbi:tetracycline resistance protein teta/multidrug resistance protein mdtg [Lucifera butyrica]|uniref:Tetracycline resistance protein teta/multidrug resistance protein mdtg n=1 Tax=Lucifera butyrica TaxID=1351585 RepID=A0A498RDQ5_9FIRM|nr:MFS transporter [Lucifera butyrica]VBB08970.1 tetracycline resistance protein teta/multidrug resistance protein mdtg [Lucifera butyrica]
MEIWKRNLFVCWFGVFVTSLGLSQIVPILPLYIAHLGIHDTAKIEQWAGITFGVTTLVMAAVSPLWGWAADKYGRKPMLLRASLGMCLVISSMGFVQNVYQLLGLRLLQGTISGFYSGSITLIATQTPTERAGWALGTLATGAVGGTLLGPLLGGYLAETMGFRSVFLSIGALLLVAFLLSLLFVKEDFTASQGKVLGFQEVWRLLPNPGLLVAMFVTTFVLQLALYSIEPIITVYIGQLSRNTAHIALISGTVFAASGFASMLAAPRLGKLSDRIGPQKVILTALIAGGLLFIPQAWVQNAWQLGGLRLLLGIVTAALLPSINTLLKRNTPDEVAGRAFGYNQAAQFLGMFSGSVLGGQIAAAYGIHYVFFVTSTLLLLNALWVYRAMLKRLTECEA